MQEIDDHRIQGTAAFTVANLLDYCMKEGKIDRALDIWGFVEPDVSQIKQAIQAIAEQYKQSAESHQGAVRAFLDQGMSEARQIG